MDIEPINITEESPLEVTPLLARRRSTVSASSTDTTSITRSTAGQSVEEKPEFRFLDEEASDVAGISTSYQMLTVPETAEQAPEQNVTEQTSLSKFKFRVDLYVGNLNGIFDLSLIRKKSTCPVPLCRHSGNCWIPWLLYRKRVFQWRTSQHQSKRRTSMKYLISFPWDLVSLNEGTTCLESGSVSISNRLTYMIGLQHAFG
ncbi:uncharacterized protein TNCV_827371 [Trichonephila clavipes]|nr:uncharacterized protein TNCV_827371 [Trichonephila clavipes]